MLGRQTSQALAKIGRHGVTPACGFEAHQPTAGGRRSNRAKTVGTMSCWQYPRPDRSGRPTARSSRDTRQVPGVAGGTVKLRLASEAQTQLTGVSLAEDHQSSALQPFD